MSKSPLNLETKQKMKNEVNWKGSALLYLIMVPVWLFALLPLTIIYKIVEFAMFKTKLWKKEIDKAPEDVDSSHLNKTEIDKNEREFDLIVYGATGFTGNFLSEYLTNNYNLLSGDENKNESEKKLKWAIAGRSESKLNELKKKLIAINENMKSLEIITADSNDLDSLWNMCSRTKVVVSTVGPYSKYGNKLIHCCVENGNDYCDITGEINWVRFNMNKYQERARATGARLVFSAGCDSVPWDIATYLLNSKVESDDELIKVNHFNDAKLGFSGGTLSTILNMIDSRFTCPISPRPKFDPLLGVLDESGNKEKSESKLIIKNANGLSKNKEHNYVVFCPLASGNSRIVSMTQAQLGYSPKMVYSEGLTFTSLVNAINFYLYLMILATCLVLKPVRKILLQSEILPNPGQGPTPDQMREHYFIIHSEGTTTKGNKIKLKTTFDRDIGYLDTARMLAETGLCFVFDSDTSKVSDKGGLYSPAAVMGLGLSERLGCTGTTFEFL